MSVYRHRENISRDEEKYLSILRNSFLERNPFSSMSYILNITLDFSSGDPGGEGKRRSKNKILFSLAEVLSNIVFESLGLQQSLTQP